MLNNLTGAKRTNLFQYKICYSKINDLFNYVSNLKRFQYKICYSKM